MLGNRKDLRSAHDSKMMLNKYRLFHVVTPAPKFTPAEIVELREARNLSRPLFAQLLNVPPVTVRKWESGERNPSGAALRLLEMMRSRPETSGSSCPVKLVNGHPSAR